MQRSRTVTASEARLLLTASAAQTLLTSLIHMPVIWENRRPVVAAPDEGFTTSPIAGFTWLRVSRRVNYGLFKYLKCTRKNITHKNGKEENPTGTKLTRRGFFFFFKHVNKVFLGYLATVLIPCTYSSCIGIKNLYFNWHYNDNGTMLKLCEAVIPTETVEPRVSVYHERVEFVGSSKKSNISILLWNITFEDEGDYVCFARNPKEKNRNHSAVFTLLVVDQVKEVDNTLTTIIVSVVGGVIGFLIIFMVVKALVVHFILKKDDKNKECLVGSSAGVDNTENGHTTAKGADTKGTPKA